MAELKWLQDPYVKQHNIIELIDKLMQDLISNKPEKPIHYISKFFKDQVKKRRIKE